MAKNLRDIYQIKITLNHTRPPIWRRLLVSSTTDLSELHQIIQVAMGWMDSHLHQYIVGTEYYGEPEPDFDSDVTPEYGVRIGSILKEEKESIVYEYDFGDGWEHEIVLEKILPFDTKDVLPKCLEGGRSCPPEDVGGVWGYQDFLEAYNDNNHPEHDEMLEWIGEGFESEQFDIDEVNEIFAEVNAR